MPNVRPLMLITLSHLLAVISILSVGAVSGTLAANAMDLPDLTGLFVCVAGIVSAFALLGSPVFRQLHLRPLILPNCPNCKKRHGNYHIPSESWPTAILVCVHCGLPTRLCLDRRRLPEGIDSTQTLYLYRPSFLGLWKPYIGELQHDTDENTA